MSLGQIDHIVVLMLENRSFDTMLGKLYPKSATFDGLDGTEQNPDTSGVPVWSGSEPAVAHRKLPGQLADYRHLFRRKIVHHILRIENLSRIRRLIDVVFDKPTHGRNGSRTSDVWHPEQLRVDVGP